MKIKGKHRKLFFLSIILLIFSLAITSSTYAWFVQNNQVSSNSISVSSGQDQFDLLASNAENGVYTNKVSIFNNCSGLFLSPVSTNNLNYFYRPLVSLENEISNFVEVNNGFYYDEIYLKARSDNNNNKKMSLYLDYDGIMTSGKNNDLYKTVRIGLVFESGINKTIILRLSDNLNSSDLVIEKVVSKKAITTTDPSELDSDYMLTNIGNKITLPANSLVDLPINKVCKLKIYVYIEGYDKDTSNDIRDTKIRIQLPLYGCIKSDGA